MIDFSKTADLLKCEPSANYVQYFQSDRICFIKHIEF